MSRNVRVRRFYGRSNVKKKRDVAEKETLTERIFILTRITFFFSLSAFFFVLGLTKTKNSEKKREQVFCIV